MHEETSTMCYNPHGLYFPFLKNNWITILLRDYNN